jgi:hypothetical protein
MPASLQIPLLGDMLTVMRRRSGLATLILVVACLAAVGKSRYFLLGSLTEASVEGKSCRYVMRVGLVFTAVEACGNGKLPNLLKGPIRVAPGADHLFFLDQDGRQHKARIVKRSPPPPPSPVS